jgi:hypothetical protein
MNISRTTVAAIAVVCTSAGASGVLLLAGVTPEAPVTPPGTAQGHDHVLETPLADAPAQVARVAAGAPARTVSVAQAAPPAVSTPPPGAVPTDSDSVERDEPNAPALHTLNPIGTITVGAPPEMRADTLEIEGLHREFEELVVDAESVIGLRLDTTVSSTTAQVEDAVDAVVTRDVLVGGRVAVAAGTRARGSVTLVERGGRLRDPARLGVRFDTLTLPDGTRLEIDSDPIYREGDAPGNESAAAIGGGAIGGAILGGILGGARGAIIGGTAGAGAGTAAAMATGPDPALLAAGSQVTIRLVRPVAVIVER